jgi:uncharacterized membrane protein YgcG
MSCRSLLWAIPLTLASSLFAGAALAVAPEIRDQGKFFSAEAVRKADEQIREIYRKHGLDLLIETYQTVPSEQAEKLKGMDAAAKQKFFTHWSEARAKERVVNGLYVLIQREPRYLIVGRVGRGLKGFSAEIRGEVEQAMRNELREGRFDDALRAAVRLVEQYLGKEKEKK